MINDKRKFFLLVATIAVAFYVVEQFDILGDENIAIWQGFIASLGPLGPISFIAIYALGAVLFLPGAAFTILGGAAFGPVMGTVWGVLGATAGAVAARWVAKLLGYDFVHRILRSRFEKIEGYNEKIKRNGFLTVLILRITPLIPYNGLNFALAYTDVNLRDYTYATAIGIIPSIVVYVILGGAITSLSTANIIYASAGIGAYGLITWVVAKKLSSRNQIEDGSESSSLND